MITLEAYGKVNLALDVTGKREDGYHLVDMIMQTVGLHDTLEMKLIDGKKADDDFGADKSQGASIDEDGANGAGISKDGIILDCGDGLPNDEGNLVYRAIKLMKDEYGLEGTVSVKLTKRIPIAAGMAGGSADAAAALKGVNRLFKLKLSDEELMRQGVKLGADIPYCIKGGTARCRGIGEIYDKLKPAPDAVILIAVPDIFVPTAEVYRGLKLNEATAHPDIEKMCASIEEGSLENMAELLGNVLETYTINAHPVIGQIKGSMIDAGALNALMSGSGPTVFGLFKEREQAVEAGRMLAQTYNLRVNAVTEFVRN